VSALEIRDEPLATRKILLALEDITERKYAAQALEAAKQQAELANLGKSRFLAAASHDLRQPLQTISLLHEILAKKVKDETTLSLVGRLDETVSTMSSMLDTLLDINQLEAGIVRREMVDFPINAVLEHLRTQFSFSRGGAWPRLARRSEQPQRAQRSPPARADGPQPTLERGEIHQ
jgi:two-component system CheB/CheR fusion protein